MFWSILLLACGPAVTENPCEDEGLTLVAPEDGAALTCADAKIPTRYLRLLAGRPLPAGSTAIGVEAVRERFLADPDAARAWLAQITARGRAIEAGSGLEAAELRAAEVHRLLAGQGPFTEADEALWNLAGPALSVRARDAAEGLALTEADIEGWIQYASLCHEARGGGVLRVSIANKADIYQMVADRFSQGNRAEKVALASFGPVWEQVRGRWQAADYAAQQAWIAAAPLPDVAQATSLAWVEAVIEGDLVGHASTLHAHFGPLHVRDGAGWFPEAGAR